MDWRLGLDIHVERDSATNKLQMCVFALGATAHKVLVSGDRIEQRWPGSPPMSSLDASSTASVPPTPCCCMSSSKASLQRPSHRSWYRVDPISCCLRISRNTKDRKYLDRWGHGSNSCKKKSKKMMRRPRTPQNKIMHAAVERRF